MIASHSEELSAERAVDKCLPYRHQVAGVRVESNSLPRHTLNGVCSVLLTAAPRAPWSELRISFAAGNDTEGVQPKLLSLRGATSRPWRRECRPAQMPGYPGSRDRENRASSARSVRASNRSAVAPSGRGGKTMKILAMHNLDVDSDPKGNQTQGRCTAGAYEFGSGPAVGACRCPGPQSLGSIVQLL